MGQKVNPTGFRLVINKNWSSKWYAKSSDFPVILKQDIDIRKYLLKKLSNASISKIIIERPAKSARITILCSKPGVVIGKKGEDVDFLKKAIQKMTDVPVHINIEEVRRPELDAKIVADNIAQQLEKRVVFRRVMKKAMQNAMKAGAKGVKIMSSGRLNGIDIARSEWYREGRVPLHTLRADVDYATSEALTTYGIIGVKVWIYKGDISLDVNSKLGVQDYSNKKNLRKTGGRYASTK